VNRANEFRAFGSAGPSGKGVLRAHLKVETMQGAHNVEADAGYASVPIAHRQILCLFSKYRSSDGMKVDIAKEGIQKVGPLGVGVESASFEPTSGARIA
jgi:hypothetical protein